VESVFAIYSIRDLYYKWNITNSLTLNTTRMTLQNMITSPSIFPITVISCGQLLHIACYRWSRPDKGKITPSYYTPRLRWSLQAHPGILGSRLLVASGASFVSAVSKSTNVRQNNSLFYRNTWDGKHTHHFMWGFYFPADVMVHCPHYVEPAFVVRHGLL
jgi:hypothetical protein